jgi:hypothetical protein
MKRKMSDNQKESTKKAYDRAEVWRSAEGMWGNQKPDPIEELNKMREEWEERLKEQEKIWQSGQHKEGDQKDTP